MTAGARLIYIADPMCSWCWGFAPELKTLRTESGLPVDVWVGGLRPGPSAQPLDEALRTYLRDTWTRIAELTGQPFAFDVLDRQDWVYDTELPAKGVVAARSLDPGKALPFFVRVQRAFYAEGVDITDPEAQTDLAREVGLDADGFAAALGSKEIHDATWQEFGQVRSIGVSGFPALLLLQGGRPAPITLGYQSAAALRPVLDAALAKGEAAEESREAPG